MCVLVLSIKGSALRLLLSRQRATLPASPLGSLYKGITIIRCLINSPSSEPRSAICLGRVHPGSPFHSGRSRTPLPRASCGAIRGIIRCDAICHGLIGLRNWNLPNPWQRRDGFSRCVWRSCLAQKPIACLLVYCSSSGANRIASTKGLKLRNVWLSFKSRLANIECIKIDRSTSERRLRRDGQR